MVNFVSFPFDVCPEYDEKQSVAQLVIFAFNYQVVAQSILHAEQTAQQRCWTFLFGAADSVCHEVGAGGRRTGVH